MDAAEGDILLPPEVGDALLRGTGRLAPYLQLARACEDMDVAGVQTLTGAVGFMLAEVNTAQHQALGWAEELSKAA